MDKSHKHIKGALTRWDSVTGVYVVQHFESCATDGCEKSKCPTWFHTEMKKVNEGDQDVGSKE